MIILSIETSCDETAISIVEATDPPAGGFPDTAFTILGDALQSQIEIHRAYGGVYPAIAKREHIATIIPVLEKALTEAHLPKLPHTVLFPEQKEKVRTILSHEGALADALLSFFERYNTPTIDLIAVTHGPGLEPALWVGINFAQALSVLWNIPVVGINHMEGHIFSSLFDGTKITAIAFPALALLISGGHTELVLMKTWGSYELVGKTRDDAVGEAFDKVARTLGLPYPGGPEIGKCADTHRHTHTTTETVLPRPMIGSGDSDFSFSGLKTAVLYTVKDKTLTAEERNDVACAFEDAVTDVLIKKTAGAIAAYGIKSLILGGGVSANTHIRRSFAAHIVAHFSDVSLYLPSPRLTTDNAVMIALAAYAHTNGVIPQTEINLTAQGNLTVSTSDAAPH